VFFSRLLIASGLAVLAFVVAGSFRTAPRVSLAPHWVPSSSNKDTAIAYAKFYDINPGRLILYAPRGSHRRSMRKLFRLGSVEAVI
jgi:hypothetical protein